ncbi:hypothetical protein MYAM1_001539 [Malassezia yamatoensis]|uniref:Uncharacterized protein n=1 Tax=Malassezia yamatoensis TaxID=253288 RepID=A0AAJ5YSA1_9BASI|nr:hypothetical protein MYAM1_001539 [Malassezia yamatoensis]
MSLDTSVRALNGMPSLRPGENIIGNDETKRTQVMLDTLDVSFERLGAGQYRLPLFSAAYYELEFFLVTSASTEAQRAHLLIQFHEGGADGFRKTLARARENYNQRQQYMEPLRTFQHITN